MFVEAGAIIDYLRRCSRQFLQTTANLITFVNIPYPLLIITYYVSYAARLQSIVIFYPNFTQSRALATILLYLCHYARESHKEKWGRGGQPNTEKIRNRPFKGRFFKYSSANILKNLQPDELLWTNIRIAPPRVTSPDRATFEARYVSDADAYVRKPVVERASRENIARVCCLSRKCGHASRRNSRFTTRVAAKSYPAEGDRVDP